MTNEQKTEDEEKYKKLLLKLEEKCLSLVPNVEDEVQASQEKE